MILPVRAFPLLGWSWKSWPHTQTNSDLPSALNTRVTHWEECQWLRSRLSEACGKQSGQFPAVKHRVTMWPSNSTPGYTYPGDLKTNIHIKASTRMLRAGWVTAAKRRNDARIHQMKDESVIVLQPWVQRMKYYSAMKRNACATLWVTLESTERKRS